ncbi:SDR family NAD(P)-dependent oxidoreductase [Rhizobium leguminosarum]|uniref:SDR family NAD(P)-dependent oxidoreductase n=1 Tax=Rhizobium leguminosarum TaxID=384 RepID=UPI003D7C1CB7
MTQQLLTQGHKVVATIRRAEALTKLAQEYHERLDIVPLDLVEPERITSAVEGAFERHGRIDVVVSNAGYGLFGAAEELTNGEIDRQIATNLTGSIHLIRAALPLLRKQGGGRIVQVSSEGGQIAYPGFSLYHATKWVSKASSNPSRRKWVPSASTSLSPSRDRAARISEPISPARNRWMPTMKPLPAPSAGRSLRAASRSREMRRAP